MIPVKNVGSNEPRTDFNTFILKVKFWIANIEMSAVLA
jgi:hypothetical protein